MKFIKVKGFSLLELLTSIFLISTVLCGSLKIVAVGQIYSNKSIVLSKMIIDVENIKTHSSFSNFRDYWSSFKSNYKKIWPDLVVELKMEKNYKAITVKSAKQDFEHEFIVEENGI